MRFVDVIAKKRDGHALSLGEIGSFVEGISSGSVPDYQASALLMAIVLRGMTGEETSALTDAMVRSGERLDLSDIPGVKVGKHSTGGVGDKVSLVLAPLVAACGVIVPKMSGRSLGHTGGTIDKLESIPGFRAGLSIDEFRRMLRDVGTAIIGQTATLVPADRTLYALRDVTGTIPSVPLIAASVMSKKLAEGSDALVLDVKCGEGAFMRDEASARALAEAMVGIGTRAGVPTEAVITGMDAPLGRAVGNALELIEAIETLKGRGPEDVTTVVLELAARMIVLGGADRDHLAARARAQSALSSGRGLETFGRMIAGQGGDPSVLTDYRRLPSAPGRAYGHASRRGHVTAVHAQAIGRASHLLGAGRAAIGDSVDHGVGVVLLVQAGDEVQAGQPVIELHHRDTGLDEALALCGGAVTIADGPVSRQAVVRGEVT